MFSLPNVTYFSNLTSVSTFPSISYFKKITWYTTLVKSEFIPSGTRGIKIIFEKSCILSTNYLQLCKSSKPETEGFCGFLKGAVGGIGSHSIRKHTNWSLKHLTILKDCDSMNTFRMCPFVVNTVPANCNCVLQFFKWPPGSKLAFLDT